MGHAVNINKKEIYITSPAIVRWRLWWWPSKCLKNKILCVCVCVCTQGYSKWLSGF